MVAAVIQFRPFSEEGRLSVGGAFAYDVMLGNRLPEEAARGISTIIEAVIGEKPSGDFDTVMSLFTNVLEDKIANGENITDLELHVVPYVPGVGLSPAGQN